MLVLFRVYTVYVVNGVGYVKDSLALVFFTIQLQSSENLKVLGERFAQWGSVI